MVNDRDLVKLSNTLEIPMVIQDILDGKEALTGDVQYGLHEVLSNYQPDSALLCIALSARIIAQRYMHRFTNMAVLRMECDRIIEDYAQLWMDHARKRPIDGNMLMDTLSDIPEDLESLTELLHVNMMLLLGKKNTSDAAGLCEVLIIQARAQVLIADSFIEAMEMDSAAPQPIQNNRPQGAVVGSKANNVIPFPYYARA